MRYLPVVALLMISLVMACGGEKAVQEPAAANRQAGVESAASEPAADASQPAVDEMAPEGVAQTGEEVAAEGGSEPTTPAEEAKTGTAPAPAEPPKTMPDKAAPDTTPAIGTDTPAEGSTPAVDTAPAQAALVSEGGAIFGRKCATCHAKDGSGDTAMGRRQGIPNLGSEKVQGLSDEELAKLVREGAGGVSRQAHLNKVQSQHEMDAVIAWIRSLAP